MFKSLFLSVLLSLSVMPAMANDYDVRDRPTEAIGEMLISDCAEYGHIVAIDEVGQWALRYFVSNVERGTLTHGFTPEEVEVYDELRIAYDKIREKFLFEMCESTFKNLGPQDHWKLVK